MMMRHHQHHYNPEEAEKEAQRQRTERDLEGTELSPLEATLGWGVARCWRPARPGNCCGARWRACQSRLGSRAWRARWRAR